MLSVLFDGLNCPQKFFSYYERERKKEQMNLRNNNIGWIYTTLLLQRREQSERDQTFIFNLISIKRLIFFFSLCCLTKFVSFHPSKLEMDILEF